MVKLIQKQSRLAIVGAGGHGKVVADTAIASEKFSEIVFLDDRLPPWSRVLKLPVIGGDAEIERLSSQGFEFVVAVGNNETRCSIFCDLQAKSVRFRSIIHPSAIISSSAEIGEGVVIFSNVCVNADAHIGSNVILNTSASIDHDCFLRFGCHVGPGATVSGGCDVGEKVFLGAGSVLVQGVTVGEGSVIGAGGVATKNVPSHVTAVGVPARW